MDARQPRGTWRLATARMLVGRSGSGQHWTRNTGGREFHLGVRDPIGPFSRSNRRA